MNKKDKSELDPGEHQGIAIVEAKNPISSYLLVQFHETDLKQIFMLMIIPLISIAPLPKGEAGENVNGCFQVQHLHR